MTSPDEAARLLHWMPILLGAKALQGRDLQFAISIVGQHSKRPGLVPSPKQVAWMKRLVDEFQAETLTDDAAMSEPERTEVGK